MEITTLLFVIIGVLLILFIFLAHYVNGLAKELRQLKQFTIMQQKSLKELSVEVQAMTSTAHGVGKRINKISSQIRELSERQEEFDLKDQGASSMQQAIALVHKGATVEELMQTCELSRGEAELLLMVHGQEDEL